MVAGNARKRLAARKIRIARKKAAWEAAEKQRALAQGLPWPPPPPEKKVKREPSTLPPVRHSKSVNALVPAETVKGVPLPPPNLRRCGVLFKGNQYYLESAIEEAKRLTEYGEVDAKTRILDLGCGSGRLLYGLLNAHEYLGLYEGVDVDKKAIDWLVERFHEVEWAYGTYLDIYNERYNPDGIIRMDNTFKLPFEDTHKFDIIYLYSLFTHLVPKDVAVYLREFKRLLKEKGTVFLTIFCEDDVDKVEENPPNYPAARYGNKHMGPLHRVRYPYKYFDELVQAAGLRIREFDHATEWNGQSGMELEHAR